MVDQTSDKRLFPPGYHGYVLLHMDTSPDGSGPCGGPDCDKIGAVLSANLIPVVRIDYRASNGHSTAVPVVGKNASEDGFQTWVTRFTYIVDQAYGQGATLFIVGNEPWNDGKICLEEYATAYMALWDRVHKDGQHEGVRLLVAGQAPHQQADIPFGCPERNSSGTTTPVNTTTWLRELTRKIQAAGRNVDGYAIHANGFGVEYDRLLQDPERPGWRKDLPLVPYIADGLWNIAVDGSLCEIPWDPWHGCRGLGNWSPEWADQGFLTFQDQINSIDNLGDRPVYITEFNPGGWGGGPEGFTYDYHSSGCPYVPANNYPQEDGRDWIVRAASAVAEYNGMNGDRVQGVLWFTGMPGGGWDYFALTENHGYLPCARQDFQYVTGVPGHTSPSNANCEDERTSLILDLSPVVKNCQAIATNYLAYDPNYRLREVRAGCSPEQSLDLSNLTEPGVIYAGSVGMVPPVNGTCVVTLTNEIGQSITRTLSNPKRTCDDDNDSPPANDHPDDTHSAADAPPIPPSIPSGGLYGLASTPSQGGVGGRSNPQPPTSRSPSPPSPSPPTVHPPAHSPSSVVHCSLTHCSFDLCVCVL